MVTKSVRSGQKSVSSESAFILFISDPLSATYFKLPNYLSWVANLSGIFRHEYDTGKTRKMGIYIYDMFQLTVSMKNNYYCYNSLLSAKVFFATLNVYKQLQTYMSRESIPKLALLN